MAIPRSHLSTALVRFIKFGLIGGLGVGVNVGVYALLRELVGMADFLSRVIAIEISVLHNFAWNFLWTWGDRGRNWSRIPGSLLRYHGSTLFSSFMVTLAVGWVVLQLLPDVKWAEYLSHLTGIAAGTVSNYLLSDRWVFTSSRRHGK